MHPTRTRAGGRRRLVFAGLAIGVVAGAAAGAALLSGASPSPAGPRPLVLHAAPALVPEGRAVELSVGTFCEAPRSASCEVERATLLARPAGVAGWTRITGTRGEGVFRFSVPAELVPMDGFAYWVELVARDGGVIPYPPGGDTSPVRVITSAGLPERALGPIPWDERAAPSETAARLPFGDADGEVGVTGGGESALEGPSSFDVGPDGALYLVDHVNGRLQVLSPRGRFLRALPLPDDRALDLAVTPGRTLHLSTLGTDATAFEVAPDGRVLGRYPVAYGVVTRVVAGPSGPHVQVGHGQWAATSAGRGVPMPAAAQARTQTSSVALADGSIGLSSSVEGGVAFVWTRPDGSRGGAVVRLPHGVMPGSDYFVRPLPDGGALAARGVWDETHYGVALLRFDATGRIRAFSLLPDPSTRMASHFSVVRFEDASHVLLAVDAEDGLRIDRFEVR